MQIKKLLFGHWQILLILVGAAILRFWRLEALTTFGGDQGYDFLIIKRMLVDGKFTLLGPKLGPLSDIANVYLGPAYYYLIAPFLFIFNFDPIGPSIIMILLSLATILIIYILCLQFFSKNVAILSSSLFSFNTLLIEQSRVALNPFPSPFFSSVVILGIFKIISLNTNILWPILTGLSLGVLFQLHYLTIALIISSLTTLVIFRKFKQTILSVAFFLVATSPQILFELRHQFFITNQIVKRLSQGDDVLPLPLYSLKFQESLSKISQLFLGADWPIILLFIIIAVTISFYGYKCQNRDKLKYLTFLLSTILTSVIFTSFYSKNLVSHYFAPIYVSLVILLATAFFPLLDLFKNYFWRTLIILLILQVFAFNIRSLDLGRSHGYTMPGGWNLKGVKVASKVIAHDVKNDQKFNIASTLDGDTRARPYRYLVEVYGKYPLDVEQYPGSEVIYLISRDDEAAIKSYTVWEVSSFAPFTIYKLSDIQNGIKLYKLTKSK